MLGFLKRAAGMVHAYTTGKALEQSYKKAEVTTLIYVQKLWDFDPSDQSLAICVWSYLLCTEPRSTELRAFREQHKDDIEGIALQILDDHELFREVIVSTLWAALVVCRSQNDKAGHDRIFACTVFKKYFQKYPMLSQEKYTALVERWAREYNPPPPGVSL